MTTQHQPKFSSLEAYHAETTRLLGEVAKAVTFVENKNASAALKAHTLELDAVLAAKDSSWTGQRKTASATAIGAIWQDHGYDSLDDLMNDHGYVRKSAAQQPSAAQNAASTGTGRNSAPKVYKYLLDEKHNDGTVDVKKGHNGSFMGKPQPWHHKIGKKPNPAFFREATDAETATMQKALDDYNAKQAAKVPRVPKQ